jgi:hypothetical protein
VRAVIDLMDSDDEDAVPPPPSATASAGVRVKLEAGLIESLPPVKLEAIAVMRGALPKLSEVQLWELLTAHSQDAAAAIQAHYSTQLSQTNSQQ